MKKVKGFTFWFIVVIILAGTSVFLYFVGIDSIVTFTKNDNESYEKVKLIISLLGPFITAFVLLNTVSTQNKSSQNLLKDSTSKDFYNILNLFKSEQKKVKNDVGEIKEKLDTKLFFLYHAEFTSMENFEIEGFKRAFNATSNGNGHIKDYYDDFQKEKDENKKSELSDLLKNEMINELIRNIDTLFSDYKSYQTFGSYLKTFHRLLKLINQRFEMGYIDYQEYSMYRGILRSGLSSDEFLIILSNAVFTQRGMGMGIEFVASSFFGNVRDISTHLHFFAGNYFDNHEILTDDFIFSRDHIKFRKKMRAVIEEDYGYENSYYKLRKDFKKEFDKLKMLYICKFNIKFWSFKFIIRRK